jgi:peptidoglycan/xylan/chitin deacetylase (PgdA/CDA1 family)
VGKGLLVNMKRANFFAILLQFVLGLSSLLLVSACGAQTASSALSDLQGGVQGVSQPASATLTPTAKPTVALPTPTATPVSTLPPVATPQLLQLLPSPLPTTASPFVAASHLGVTVAPDITTSRRLASDLVGPLAQLFVSAPDIGILAPWPTPAHPALAPTPDGIERTAHTPILMYHYLSEPPVDADIYRRDLSVAPTLFEAHLVALAENGYTTISLYDLVAFLNQGTPLPDKPVILTFDDGYRDNFDHAFPLLVKYGMKATFFVVSDFIDEERPEYLTWAMVRTMFAAGMSIEAHGRNHVSLRGKDIDYLVWQALGSLEAIEREIGVRPRFISYPAGDYDRQTIELFQSANYWGGVTTIQGATHTSANLFELRRVRIRGATTPTEFVRLLALDW